MFSSSCSMPISHYSWSRSISSSPSVKPSIFWLLIPLIYRISSYSYMFYLIVSSEMFSLVIELVLLSMPNLLDEFCIIFVFPNPEANALLFGSKFFDLDFCITCKEFLSWDFLLSGFTKFLACLSFFEDNSPCPNF